MKKGEVSIVYKALGGINEHLFSWAAFGKAKVTYAIGRVSRPPAYLMKMGYGLLAFPTLEGARGFVEKFGAPFGALNDGNYIFEARATGVRRENLPLPLSHVWGEDPIYSSCTVSDVPWPEGTMMCDTIELVKQVWPEE